jgi:hypothetical protein
MDMLSYDYGDQCWVDDGIVLACAHPVSLPGCTACNYGGEPIALVRAERALVERPGRASEAAWRALVALD